MINNDKAIKETKIREELYENGSIEDKITVLIRMKDKFLISLSTFGIGCFLFLLLVFSTKSESFAKSYLITAIGCFISFLTSLYFFIKESIELKKYKKQYPDIYKKSLVRYKLEGEETVPDTDKTKSQIKIFGYIILTLVIIFILWIVYLILTQ